MSIVCGCNFTQWSRNAQMASAHLATALGEDLWLVHVIEPDVEKMDDVATEKVVAYARDRLENEAAPLRSLSQRAIHCVVSVGKVSDELRKVTSEKGADLLVVGSPGHASSALIRLAGVSDRLATSVGVPLLVIRSPEPFMGWNATSPLRALVAIDEHHSSTPVLRWIERLRASQPVDVIVGQVYYPDEARRRFHWQKPLSYTEIDPDLETKIESELRRLVPTLAGRGTLSYRTKLGVGRIADHLLELAEAEGCHLVVERSDGHKGLARLWSVSAATVHIARMATAVIPSGES